MKASEFSASLLALLLISPSLAAQEETPEDDETNVETTHQVGGALADGPARVESIGSEDLERRGATNLSQALEWMSAGSQVSPTGTATGLLVDGLPTSQITVLRDGLPIARATGSQQGPIVDLSSIAISPESIERIDIYRGVGPVGTGAAGGIIIDIISKRRKPRSAIFGQSQVAVGDEVVNTDGLGLVSEAYSAGAQAGLSKSVGVEVLARKTDSASLDVDGDGIGDNPSLDGLYGETALTWRRPGGAFLRFQAVGTVADSETLSGPNGVFDDLIDRDTARLRAAGRWWPTDDVRLDHRSDFGVSVQDFSKRVKSSGFVRPKALTKFYDTTQNLASTWFVGTHDLAGELALNAYSVERDGETGVLPTETEVQAGLGLADTWYISKKVETFTRVFAEMSSAYGPALNGQLSGALRPVDNLGFRGAASITRRAPTPEELYLFFDHSEVGYQVEGNPDLRPETLHSFQLATLLHTKDRSSGLEVMGFYHYLTNAITTVGVTGNAGLFSYENRAAAHTAGLQATAETEVIRSLTLVGNYTWMPLAIDAEDSSRLPLRAEHAARVEVRKSFLNRKLQLWADSAVRSSMAVPAGTPPAGAYGLIGVGASYRISAYRVMLDLNNLLDQVNPDWGPLPGRHALLSIQARYDFVSSRDRSHSTSLHH